MKRNPWHVLAVVSSALFLITVDMTVLYTALPTLTHDLKATSTEKLWILNAYALTVAGLLPGLGTLGDRVGHRKMLLSGLCVFGTASLVAAFAPSAGLLIAARIVLGIGAAMMMPATLSIIRGVFENADQRTLAFGVWGAVSSGGAALGPVVGGILLEHFSWGSVFLINVPVVGIALLTGARILPEDRPDASRHWSPLASLFIMLGLAGVIFAVKEAGRPGASLWTILAPLGAGALGLFLFVRGQWGSRSPLIDFSLFRNRGFSLGVCAALLLSLSMIGVELALSQRLQLVLGLTPLQAGLAILPLPLAAFVGGPLAGWVLPRMGLDKVLYRSLFVSGFAMAGLLFARDGGQLLQGLCMAAMGLGMGAGMSVASAAIMNGASRSKSGMAASIEEVSFELGGALGIAVFGSILTAVYTASLTLPEGVPVLGEALNSIDGAILAAETMPAAAADSLLYMARGAFDKAFAAVIGIAAVPSLCLALLLLMRRRPESAR